METKFCLIIGVLLLIIFVLAMVIRFLLKKNRETESKRQLIQFKFDFFYRLVKGVKESDPDFWRFYVVNDLLYKEFELFRNEIFWYFIKNFNEWGEHQIDRCLSNIDSDIKDEMKKSFIMCEFEKALFKTPPERLVAILVQSIIEESQKGKLITEHHKENKARGFILMSILNNGKTHERAVSFIKKFDEEIKKALSGEIEGLDPDIDRKKIIESESIKLHRLFD